MKYMIGFPSVRELGNPEWDSRVPFSTWKDFGGIFTGLWFVLLIVLLFVLFVFEFLLFCGNPKIFLENFQKNAFNTRVASNKFDVWSNDISSNFIKFFGQIIKISFFDQIIFFRFWWILTIWWKFDTFWSNIWPKHQNLKIWSNYFWSNHQTSNNIWRFDATLIITFFQKKKFNNIFSLFYVIYHIQ